MKRELLFRIWSKRYDSFLWNDALRDFLNDSNIPIDIDYIDLDCSKEQVIQQYTGFKDKSGNKIYEGDILKFDDEVNLTVCFGYRGAWMLSDGCNWTDEYLVDYHKTLGIIGNILENPELK